MLLLPSPHGFQWNDLCFLLWADLEVPRRRSGGSGHVGELLDEVLVQLDAFGHQQLFVVGQRNELQHADQVGLAFDQLLHGGALGSVVGAASAGQAMQALRPERVGAKAVSEIVILPALPARRRAVHDRVLVQQHFNGGQVLFQVSRLRYLAGKPGGVDPYVVLGRGELLVPQVLFELEDVQRLLCIVEHGSNGGARSMAGNGPAAVLVGNASFAAQVRDEVLINVPLRQALATVREEEGHHLARLVIERSGLFPRSNALPLVDALADQRMNRFGIGGDGLVDRNVQKADRISRKDFSGFRDHDVFVLPADAAHPKADDLIGAERGKAPHDGHGSNHLQRVAQLAIWLG